MTNTNFSKAITYKIKLCEKLLDYRSVKNKSKCSCKTKEFVSHFLENQSSNNNQLSVTSVTKNKNVGIKKRYRKSTENLTLTLDYDVEIINSGNNKID